MRYVHSKDCSVASFQRGIVSSLVVTFVNKVTYYEADSMT
jgi:hypothetical protein